MTIPIVDFALHYATQGWPVIPLHTIASSGHCSCSKSESCTSSGKHPRTGNGLKDGTTDPETIQQWWTRWPDSNIGLLTGQSSGVVVLDVDSDHGGYGTLDKLQQDHGILPDTPMVATGGGGRHYYFAAPSAPMSNRNPMRQGIDFKAEAGYVVAPPSMHRSGNAYEWDLRAAQFAPLPLWLEAMVREKERQSGELEVLQVDISMFDWDGTIPQEIEFLVATSSRVKRLFQRDKRLKSVGGDASKCDFALACTLYQAGINDRKAIAFGLMASRRNDPDAWAGVARKAQNYFSETVRNAIRKVNAERERIQEVERVSHPALRSADYRWNELGNSQRFVKIHGRDLLYHNTEKRWRVWDGRYFSDGFSGELGCGGEAGFSQRVQAFQSDLWALPASIDEEDELFSKAETFVRRSGSAGMLSAIATFAKAQLVVHEEELDHDSYALNALNGIVDLRTGVLGPHNREQRCTWITGAPYEPGAVSQEWNAFLTTAIPDPEERIYFQKCMGYSLLGVQPEQVFFFIHGPGATGKSTAIKAIQGACGSYHRTADFSTFLQQGGRSGGGSSASPDLARLARVRLVSSTEVGHGQALNDGLIKQLSGGDMVTSRGLYADNQEWRPIMGLWLVANDRPKGRVDDDALWRRLRPFEFSQKIDESAIDSQLGTRLASLECRTAILAWMIHGARYYLDTGHLNPPASIRAGIQNYRASSNPLTEFYEDMCMVGEGRHVKRTDLWNAYRFWCGLNGSHKVGKTAFFKILKSDFMETVRDGYPVILGISTGK